jgi:predicted transcriptional regulator
LEAEVLADLWRRNEPATPGEVLEAIDADLAYTTVMTILTRLWRKGLVERHRDGRAYAYSPKLTEAQFAAQRMQAALAKTQDRKAALVSFTDGLPKRDLQLLRRILDRSTPS